MIQTSYSPDPPLAVAGMMADDGVSDVLSRGAAVNLGFGVACIQGTTDGTCKLPTGSPDLANLLGVSVYDSSLPPAGWPPGWPGAYGTGSTVRVLRKGRIWVMVEEAVTPTSQVFIRYAASGDGIHLATGTFRASADTATAGVILNGARYLTTAAPAGFAILELNLPG